MVRKRRPDIQPELVVVIDTEEEFDWTKPFSRANVATRSLPAQQAAQDIYVRLGIVPTYVIGYPIATDPVGAALLRRWRQDGQAEIGAHLHPWVTPPHRETVSTYNSYQCNLPPALERAKIEVLTEAITAAVGATPTIFKAGRHGFGPSTRRTLSDLGYQVDCSLLPYSDLRADGGPNHMRVPSSPFWLDEASQLLEVPVTAGFFGAAPGIGRRLPGLFNSRSSIQLHLPGLLGKCGLATRSRLSPEDIPLGEQCKLLDALVRQGQRTFTLVYHSPSLMPGNTPYVKDEVGLRRFLDSIEQVALYFRDRLGGRFTTLTEVHQRMAAELYRAPSCAPTPPARLSLARGERPTTARRRGARA
jgi:hypothetical protein